MIIDTGYSTVAHGYVTAYKGAEIVGTTLRVGVQQIGSPYWVADGGIVEMPLVDASDELVEISELASRVPMGRNGYLNREVYGTHVVGCPEESYFRVLFLTEHLTCSADELRYKTFWEGGYAASPEQLRKYEGTGWCYSGDKSSNIVLRALSRYAGEGKSIIAIPVDQTRAHEAQVEFEERVRAREEADRQNQLRWAADRARAEAAEKDRLAREEAERPRREAQAHIVRRLAQTEKAAAIAPASAQHRTRPSNYSLADIFAQAGISPEQFG